VTALDPSLMVTSQFRMKIKGKIKLTKEYMKQMVAQSWLQTYISMKNTKQKNHI